MTLETSSTAAERWNLLHSRRTSHLNRARKCAELTLPHLLPPENSDENTPLPTPYQGLGSRAVNHLSSKLLLTLFPPNRPCLRFKMDGATIESLKEQMGDEGFKTEIEEKLASREWDVAEYMETSNLRVPSARLLRLLIVTGNALEYLPKGGGMRVFRLDQYVVRRNPAGKVLEIIIKEQIAPADVPEAIRGKIKANAPDDDEINKYRDLFTHVQLKQGKWEVYQEIEGITVPGSKGSYPEDNSPWKALTWSRADGEDYGRGHVEEHLGDFISLEELSKAVIETAAASAKLIFLVNPNGSTRKKDLIDTENAGFAVGLAEDISVLRVEKMNDLQTPFEMIQLIERRLSHAFLLHTAVQREAERVTAEEIRYMAQELEDALGGIYSSLATEFQLPTVKAVIRQMEAEGLLPPMPKEIKPVITTGLEALGRGHDLQRLNGFIQNILPLGPELLMKFMNLDDYIDRLATAYGVDKAGLIKSKEEIAQEEQQAAQMQQQQQLLQLLQSAPAAQAVKGMADAANQQRQQQNK